ncbi:HEPN domain-containing protein [Bacillus altitudinis]|uniref:HEPN domain-containing protein n=1 Tax=Bacillus altitudinis TaxID=293387 RepID=UPI00064CDAB3|nr:HEPN domain-containing protein [Bacillus altitudinis]KLV22118.1 hypothetical protein ABW03_11195 [Bacillus altitudinis]
MIKFKFVAGAYSLKVAHKMNRGTEIFNNIRISNSSERIINNFRDDFKSAIGDLEYEYLLSSPYYYSDGKIENFYFEDDTLGMDLLKGLMDKIQFINTCLWLVKDNSIHTDKGYLQLQNGDEIKFHSTSRTTTFNNSQGKQDEVIFDSDELKYPNKIFDFFYRDSDDVTISNEVPMYEGSRLERAFYLLQAARPQNYLPERIAIFTTLLETLFSTSNTDVTHKLRERIAWLLGTGFNEREKIFDDMGVIYGIRSNHVHNSTVPKNARTSEQLIAYSSTLECYVRSVLIRILTEENIYKLYQKNQKGKYDDSGLEKFFKDICLGKSYV